MIPATVIICTHNRAAILPRAVEVAVAEARALGAPAEVVVVDNASTDATPGVIASLTERWGDVLRPVSEPSLGLSAARNRGLAVASGQVVAYLDDDAVPRRGWLQALLEAFQEPAVVCAGGRIVVRFGAGEPEWFRPELAAALSGFDLGTAPRRLRYGRSGDVYPYGANIAFRTAAVRAAGGFSTLVGLRGTTLLAHEETDLCYRLEQAGGEIHYAPGAVVDHWVLGERLTPAWFLRRFEAGGRSAALFVLRNRGVARALWRLRWLYASVLLAPRYTPTVQVDPERFARECRRREAWGYVAGVASGLRRYRELRTDGRESGAPARDPAVQPPGRPRT